MPTGVTLRYQKSDRSTPGTDRRQIRRRYSDQRVGNDDKGGQGGTTHPLDLHHTRSHAWRSRPQSAPTFLLLESMPQFRKQPVSGSVSTPGSYCDRQPNGGTNQKTWPISLIWSLYMYLHFSYKVSSLSSFPLSNPPKNGRDIGTIFQATSDDEI